MIPPELMCQILVLEPGCDFVVAGIQHVAGAQAIRKDVRMRSEYWVDDFQWVFDKDRPVVFDTRFESEDVWKSPKFLAGREVMRRLKRTT